MTRSNQTSVSHARAPAESLALLPQNHTFTGIDLVKFLCAFLICIVHIHPITTNYFGEYALNFWLKQYFARIAVPFFFTASGFLFFRKTALERPDAGRLKAYCFRTLRLLGTWTLLLFVGSQRHLWFLGAVVIAVSLLWLLLKKGVPVKYLALLATLLYICGLLGNSYFGFAEPLNRHLLPHLLFAGYKSFFVTTRNGVFFGFPYVFMGAMLAHKRIRAGKLASVCGFAVSMVLLFFEIRFLKNRIETSEYDMFVFLIPATYFLFCLATHLTVKNGRMAGRLRRMSMLIFYLHEFVFYFVNLAIAAVRRLTQIELLPLRFPAVIVCVTLLAFLIVRLSDKKTFRWLKYLYS